MNQGIERLARAMRPADWSRADELIAQGFGSGERQQRQMMKEVIAVLTALRDECGTNEEMIEAGVYATAPNILLIPADSATRQAELDMLDHAKGEAVATCRAMINHLLAPETGA
jgi:hypothetical protein